VDIPGSRPGGKGRSGGGEEGPERLKNVAEAVEIHAMLGRGLRWVDLAIYHY